MIHENSRQAIKEITTSGERKNRAEQILDIFKEYGFPMTDRGVLMRLFPGSDNLNLVRPRITELINKGQLQEVGNVMDFKTQKQVRSVYLTKDQMNLF